MRKLITTLLFILVPPACASHPSDAPSVPAPTHCSKSDRHGTYLVSFSRLSGTCGDQSAALISFDSSPTEADGGDACVVHSAVWSENDCKLDGSVTCHQDGIGSTDTITVSTQKTQDGSVLDGVATFTTPDCTGTYRVHYERQ